MKKIFLVSTVVLIFASPLRAAEAELPVKMQQRLRSEATSCGFRLQASGFLDRLQADQKVADVVTARVKSHGDSARLLAWLNRSGGLAGFATAVVGMFDLRHGASAAGAASSFAASSLESFLAKKIAKEDWSFDEADLGRAAGEDAEYIGRILGFDALKKDALRSAIIKSTRRRLEAHQQWPVPMLDILRRAERAGKPILTAEERKALDAIEGGVGAAGAATGGGGLKTDEERVNFLATCREMLSVALPALSAPARAPAEKVIAQADSFLADLRAFGAAHPGAAGLKPRPAAEPGNAETSIDVR